MEGNLSDCFLTADSAEAALDVAVLSSGLRSTIGSAPVAAAVRAARRTRGPGVWLSRGDLLALAGPRFLGAVFFSGFIRRNKRENGANLTGEAYVEAKRARNVKLAAPKFSWTATLS
jgi:hypothetical protein